MLSFFIFKFSVLTYLANVEWIEEDSIEEVLEAKEHHLDRVANHSQAVLNMNSKANQKTNDLHDWKMCE